MKELKEQIINENDEEKFQDAMKKRQYDRALNLMTSILSEEKRIARENNRDINPDYLEMARSLALRYFKHQTSKLETAKKTIKNKSLFAVSPPLYSYRGLNALWKLSKIFNFKISIAPEAQDKNSELHKALKSQYDKRLTIEDYRSSYELGKIGGFLNKGEYKKIFDLAVDRNSVGAAHRYATEGKLYNVSDPQIKSWLDELKSASERKTEIAKKRIEENLGLREFMEKYGDEFKSLTKRKEDVEELLVASIE